MVATRYRFASLIIRRISVIALANIERLLARSRVGVPIYSI